MKRDHITFRLALSSILPCPPRRTRGSLDPFAPPREFYPPDEPVRLLNSLKRRGRQQIMIRLSLIFDGAPDVFPLSLSSRVGECSLFPPRALELRAVSFPFFLFHPPLSADADQLLLYSPQSTASPPNRHPSQFCLDRCNAHDPPGTEMAVYPTLYDSCPPLGRRSSCLPPPITILLSCLSPTTQTPLSAPYHDLLFSLPWNSPPPSFTVCSERFDFSIPRFLPYLGPEQRISAWGRRADQEHVCRRG